MLIEGLTLMILNGKTTEARAEILAVPELAAITGQPEQLNSLQRRDLLEAIREYEILNGA